MSGEPVSKKVNPTQLLQNQVELLERIRELEVAQQQLLNEVQRTVTGIETDLSDWYGSSAEAQDVTISNFNMPFVDLIGFLVKIALASIPAAIIIGIVYFIVFGLLLGSLM